MDRIESKIGGSYGGALRAAAAAAAGIGYGGGAKTKKSNKFGNAKPVDTATKMSNLKVKPPQCSGLQDL